MSDESRSGPQSRPEALGIRGAGHAASPRLKVLKKKAPPRRPTWRPGDTWVLALVTLAFALMGAGTAVLVQLSRLPDVGVLENWRPHQSTQILDRKGRLLGSIHGEENREYVPLASISIHLREAVIAVEDEHFLRHRGVNLRGIVRAAITDLLEGRRLEGGSTITQQLAKNLFLSPSRSLFRKLADAYLAIRIEQRFTKDRILEMYLNQVYWGYNCYGIQAASRLYFGKRTDQLTLSESALLAFLLRGPERYSPYRNRKRIGRYLAIALERMADSRYISESMQRRAERELPTIQPLRRVRFRAPYFTNFVLRDLRENPPTVIDPGSGRLRRLDLPALERGGYRIVTTLDLPLQERAEQLLVQTLKAHGKTQRFSQGAVVVLDPKTGDIRALVGGTDFQQSQFNRAVQARRQPGSLFKPFVYLTAFDETGGKLSPATTMSDARATYPGADGRPWSPENFGGRHEGTITLRRALEQSNNVIAVKVLERVGIQPVIRMARAIGIQPDTPLTPTLSLALGASEVSPLEIASCYGVFASDGKRAEPRSYLRIVDRQGHLVAGRPDLGVPADGPAAPRQVVASESIRLLNDVMQGVVLRGTGFAARLDRPVAGKTGTTSDHRDAWFIGYTPDLVGLVWLGNDDNSPMSGGTTGGMVCAPLWKAVMSHALQGFPPTPFFAPQGTVRNASASARPRTRQATTDATPTLSRAAGSPVPAPDFQTPQPTEPLIDDEPLLVPPEPPPESDQEVSP